MFRSYDQSQLFLLPRSLQDFVDERHPAHVMNDLVDQLDLRVPEARYGNLGQPAYHPRLMLKVILYGFTVGVFTPRRRGYELPRCARGRRYGRDRGAWLAGSLHRSQHHR